MTRFNGKILTLQLPNLQLSELAPHDWRKNRATVLRSPLEVVYILGDGTVETQATSLFQHLHRSCL